MRTVESAWLKGDELSSPKFPEALQNVALQVFSICSVLICKLLENVRYAECTIAAAQDGVSGVVQNQEALRIEHYRLTPHRVNLQTRPAGKDRPYLKIQIRRHGV
jgi:hypothetical protein